MSRIKKRNEQIQDLRRFAVAYGKHLIYGNASTLLTDLFIRMTPSSSTTNPVEEAILDKLQAMQRGAIYRSDQQGKKAKKFASKILDWEL
jgi:hypothetical protein